MLMNVLGLLAGMTVFYLIRYFSEESYKKREKKWIVADILITTLLGAAVLWIVDVIRN